MGLVSYCRNWVRIFKRAFGTKIKRFYFRTFSPSKLGDVRPSESYFRNTIAYEVFLKEIGAENTVFTAFAIYTCRRTQ